MDTMQYPEFQVALLVLVMDSCYGQTTTTTSTPSYTCETNSGDNYCYCVLDSTKATDNWFSARSYCRQYLNGDLVDIDSTSANTFVQNLLGASSGYSLTGNAWLGVTDIATEGSFRTLLYPSVSVTYNPADTSTPPNTDTSKNCVVMYENAGVWTNVNCANSGGAYSTLCRVQTRDAFGYDSTTGCPLNTALHDSKCYGVYTISSSDTKYGIGAAVNFCRGLEPAGKLLLPESANANVFVQNLIKQSEIDKFWLRIERSGDGNFWVYGTGLTTAVPYENWDATKMATITSATASAYSYVINVETGKWEPSFSATLNGVICQFDSAPLSNSQPTVPSSTGSSPCGPSPTSGKQ